MPDSFVEVREVSKRELDTLLRSVTRRWEVIQVVTVGDSEAKGPFWRKHKIVRTRLLYVVGRRA